MRLEEALAQGTQSPDEAEGRIYGWLPGIVTEVDTKLKQVRARIGKQGDNESTDWLTQMGMGSIESLPEVNDPVGVVFMDGDVHRGAYFYFPQSNTNNRPTSPMMLGDKFVGMFNYLITQYNQLRTDFNQLCSTLATHTHGGVFPGSSSTGTAVGIAPASTSATAGQKGKASDGSLVADKSTSEVVLSKRSLCR